MYNSKFIILVCVFAFFLSCTSEFDVINEEDRPLATLSSAFEDWPSSSSAKLSSSSVALSSSGAVLSSSSGAGATSSSGVALSSSGAEPVQSSSGGQLVQSSSGEELAASSSSVVVQSSSSGVEVPSSSSGVAPKLSCGTLASKGYVGKAITPPALSCSSGVLSDVVWSGVPAWENPVKGAYSVGATASCDGVAGLTVSCGNLNVNDQPTLLCNNFTASGIAGKAIAPPTLSCSDGTLTGSGFEDSPVWSLPLAGSYVVKGNGNCGLGELKVDCGTLNVAEATLSCGSVAGISGAVEGKSINKPKLSCDNDNSVSSADYSGFDWDNPTAGSHNISVNANCGTGTNLNASCGTLVVEKATLSCNTANITGVVEGKSISERPKLTCNNGYSASSESYSGINWNNPTEGDNNFTATANCGNVKGLSADCKVTAAAVSLTCTNMPTNVTESVNVGTSLQPKLTCNNGSTATSASYAGITWSKPTAGPTTVSVTATCGTKSVTASCGTLNVTPISLTCTHSIYGFSGVPITERPTLGCNITRTPENEDWITNLDWGNPAVGEYDLSVTAECYPNRPTAICGKIKITCSGRDNTPSQYCSNGVMKNYGTLTDDRDHKTYNTVAIGNQTWMAENLNYISPDGKSRCYEDLPANCNTYGRLYSWQTAMDGSTSSNLNPSEVQGICPDGWHLPSSAEFATLYNFVGPDSAGYKLASTTSDWTDPNHLKQHIDNYGFTALPGGLAYSWNAYYNNNAGNTATFWTSVSSSTVSGRASRCDVYNFNQMVISGYNDPNDSEQGDLRSIRCVKN
ncbi:MAG: hypothetical protein FWC26_06130 [Fibromonadales bacterium]|nr:hypothetical protein [Fibromonadales bacterium]